MSEPPELPPRPLPPRAWGETALAWLRWFGVGRLAAGALAVLVVVGGAVWLLRTPIATTEAGLPTVTGTGSAPTVTLAPPPTSAAPAVQSSAPLSIVVHVAGAVQRPGVHLLPATARVAEAVDAAGGATATGDLDGLNLAAPLVDGERVYVPEIGEVDPASVPSRGAPADPAGGVPVVAGPLDLNSATAAELEALPGVGPATAAAIVDDRDRNGPFASVDDLDRVPGIGPAKLAALRELVTA